MKKKFLPKNTSKRIVFGLSSVSLTARYFAHVTCVAISPIIGHSNNTLPLTIAVLFVGCPSKMYGLAGKRSVHNLIYIPILEEE